MAKGNETASFALNLEGNAASGAKATADALTQLRASITASSVNIKELNAAQRALKGSSDEVVAAKNDLKAKLLAEQQALSNSTLESLKNAKALKTLDDAAKHLADEQAKLGAKTKALSDAVSTAGGPVAALKAKLDALKEMSSGAGGKMALFALGTAAAVAAVVAIGVAIAHTLSDFSKFVIVSADAARSAALLRTAAVGGNETWGKQFGEQSDALSKKIPTARGDIDKLGISLTKSNIGGQLWVDSINAISQASAALGDDAGSKIKSFIDRSMVLGRPGLFRINATELIGTGVTFQEVAASLASSMHVGVDKASSALRAGTVKLGDGAAALRGAVEKKFGKINLSQMLSLDNLSKKFSETLQDLTKGVNLEPLLKGVKEIAGMFDLSTTSGQALKQLVGIVGNDLVGAFTASVPLIKSFTYGLILGAQNVAIGYLTVRNSIRNMIGPDALSSIGTLNLAVTAGKIAIVGLGIAVAGVGAALALITAPLLIPVLLIAGIVAAVYGAVEAFEEFGPKIVDGLVSGLSKGAGKVKAAVASLASDVKSSFADALGIHSPSVVFAEYGKHTTEGFSKGVDSGSGGAQASVDSMISVPSVSRSGASSGAPVNVSIVINASGANAKDVASEVSSSGVIEQLTNGIMNALQGAGYPLPA